jgi:Bacterial nucleoid DNA-binding protein
MANVTKKDIVEIISNATGLTQVDTRIVVESFLEAVSKTLREGKNIEIRGFGRFKIKERKARMGRNPHTNAPVQVQQVNNLPLNVRPFPKRWNPARIWV